MSFKIAHADDCETTGNWHLVRRTLGVRAFGINVVDIPPGEQIPEHDETGRDQEELFYVLAGSPTLFIDGEAASSLPRVRSRASTPIIGARSATLASSSRLCSSSLRPDRVG